MRWTAVAAIAFVTLVGFSPLVPHALAGSTTNGGSSACIAHRPNYIEGSLEVRYVNGCSGHDEPELDPVSNAAGSARDLTWTAILPSDGKVPVSAVGPTFWFGGSVTDPNSLFGQAFVELQFYPDGVVSTCTPGGGFILTHVANAYSVCSPVWKLTQTGQKGVFHETAAFNAMLTDSRNASKPLVMYGGDEITVHWFTTSARDGYHVTVRDWTRGGHGTIVLNSSKDGPLMPAFDRQRIGNALSWGLVNDTPNSFVWEIGHTSPFTAPKGEFCLPGETECASYDRASWAGTLPIQILGVTFGDGSNATRWAVVSDFGGKAEIAANCPTYGTPHCIYPWFSEGSSGFRYGVNFPGTVDAFGKAAQFELNTTCGGPFGQNSTYCDRVVVP